MMMTVKDCLSLDAFKNCRIVAGKRKLGNPVKTISVLDAKDVETAVKRYGVKGQLILASNDSMEGSHTNHVEAVKALADCGISAMVIFHLDEDGESRLNETIDVAEEAGLPLIVMPENSGVEYADVIEQMMDKILVGDERHNLINNTIYHLLDFDKHKTFQSALKEAAKLNNFQVVLVSKDFNPVLIVENRHNVTVIDAVRNLQKSENIGERTVYSTLSIEGLAAYWGNIELGGEDFFLLIVDNEEQYSAVDITKLAEVIELAMGMWKYTPERDVKAEFVKSLMRGNKSLAYTLKEEMDLSKDAKIKSVFYAKDINAGKAREIIEDFERKTRAEVISIFEDGETYGLIFAEKNEGRDVEDKSIYDFYERFKGNDEGIRFFHVTGLSSLEEAAEGFNLIGETWRFVESVFPFKRVFSKFELVLISNCVDIQVRGGRIKNTYVELLSPFEEGMGANKAKQLMNTLETFVLDAGMNSNLTSKIMDVHANTIQYRLKRINDILGVDITTNRVTPAITIALALKRMDSVN